MRRTVAILAFVGIVLAVLPFACDGERHAITEQDRAGKPGQFASLSQGVTHYEIAGPAKGRPVLLVHGFSVPYFIYDFVFEALVQKGFRVIRLDLYGRGLSDRPDVVYGLDLYDRQLTDLLDYLKISRVHIVGSSMGGLITANFLRKHPERVSRAVFIAPAGFPMPLPISAKIGRAPYIGDYIVRVAGDRIFVKNNSASFFGNVPPGFYERFGEQMQFKGYKRALLSSLRNMPLESGASIFDEAGRKKIPSIVIWSRQDGVLPYSNAIRAQYSLGASELISLEGTGHTPHFENPQMVIPHILKFFQ